MNLQIQNLKGSPKRDIFKWAHKNKMNNAPFYASDCDLCIVSFKPRGVIAYFDYKGSGEGITDSETVLYDEWAERKPVYIIEGGDPENGPFTVKQYESGKEPEHVIDLKGWDDFLKWEASLRREFATTCKPTSTAAGG